MTTRANWEGMPRSGWCGDDLYHRESEIMFRKRCDELRGVEKDRWTISKRLGRELWHGSWGATSSILACDMEAMVDDIGIENQRNVTGRSRSGRWWSC